MILGFWARFSKGFTVPWREEAKAVHHAMNVVRHGWAGMEQEELWPLAAPELQAAVALAMSPWLR